MAWRSSTVAVTFVPWMKMSRTSRGGVVASLRRGAPVRFFPVFSAFFAMEVAPLTGSAASGLLIARFVRAVSTKISKLRMLGSALQPGCTRRQSVRGHVEQRCPW